MWKQIFLKKRNVVRRCNHPAHNYLIHDPAETRKYPDWERHSICPWLHKYTLGLKKQFIVLKFIYFLQVEDVFTAKDAAVAQGCCNTSLTYILAFSWLVSIFVIIEYSSIHQDYSEPEFESV